MKLLTSSDLTRTDEDFISITNWDFVAAHHERGLSSKSPFISRIRDLARANGLKGKITLGRIARIVNSQLSDFTE